MPTTIQEVLSGRILTGTIQTVKAGVGEDALPPGLVNPSTVRVEGETGTYYLVEGTRQTARLVQQSAPSVRRTMSGVQTRNVNIPRFAENMAVKADTLTQLESTDTGRQDMGVQEVARMVAESKQVLVNGRNASIISAFALGAIYYDSAGQLLPTSAGAAVTINYSVPSGNQAQLNVDGTGAVIAATWATAATGIVKQIQNLRKAARKLTGYPLKHALYGSNVLDYILSNTQLKEIINRSPAYQEAFSAGVIPNGLLGFTWWPAYETYFASANGTVNEVFGADTVTFIPDPSVEWYERMEGATRVPKGVAIATDLSDAHSNSALTTGMYSYAYQTLDPLGHTMVYGDVQCPVIKVPGAVFIAKVANF